MNSIAKLKKNLPAMQHFSGTSQKRAGMNIVKFMALLLVLTIIARGASGATMTRVSTTNPGRGEIALEVTGNAVVSSVGTLDVFAPEGLMIAEMLASVGQTVDIGDAIAKFDMHELTEKLVRENAALDRLLLDLEVSERTETVDSNNLTNNQRYLARAREDYNLTKAQGEADVVAAQSVLNNAQSALNDALNAQTAQAAQAAQAASQLTHDAENESDIDAADAYTPVTPDESDADKIHELQAAVDAARASLEAAQRRAQDDLRSANRRIEDAEAGLSAASQDHERNLDRRLETAESNRISATVLRLEIEEQEAIVNELQMLLDNNGTLHSNITGVASAMMNRGDVTNKDALITLRDGAKGYEASMQLDKEDADKLSIGSECEVTTGRSSMFYVPTVTGIVSAITPPDENDKVKITIRLPQGDWTEGQRIDVQAIQSRSIYDMCIPLSALRSDNTGYFVLLVEQRSSVLGVENVVVQMPVTVLASDSDKASVEGPISRSSQIITGSNKAVTAGDRVRVD